LLIDASSSITARFHFEKDAIREFLHRGLCPLDSALLIAGVTCEARHGPGADHAA
jgi:hypothetical protein